MHENVANEDPSVAPHAPRRHSLMGSCNTPEGIYRQRSIRALVSSENGDGPQSSSRRTTTVPRRMSTGGNAGCRDLGGRRPSASANVYTGETIAAIGGATIKW